MIVGVIGKANVGKSTFFKSSTLSDVEIANYPFATIKPNIGVGYVRIDCADKFFNTQCNPREGFCIDNQRFVPVQMIDVAGLVPGAHEGKGLGNQFLDDLRQADVLIHVVDVSGSTNEIGEPVAPLSYDPINDVKFLEDELDFWYVGIIKKTWEKFARQIQQEHSDVIKAIAKQLSGLKVNENMVKAAVKNLDLAVEKPTTWTEKQIFDLAKFLRKETKPMIIAANKIDVPGADKNLDRLKKEFPEYIIIGCSAESELALKEASKHELIKYLSGDNFFEFKNESKLNEKQKNALEFIDKNVLKRFNGTGIQEILNKAVFELLKYIPIFPGGLNKLQDQYGNVLPDCFLIPPNSTALDFAFKIHTDLGKKFIRAIDVKKRITVGKEHKLKFGDVVEIIT